MLLHYTRLPGWLRQPPQKTPDTLAAQSLYPSPLNFPTAEW